MPVVELAIVVGLIALNGFLAMSELALVSARRPLLEQMARHSSRGAEVALGPRGGPNAVGGPDRHPSSASTPAASAGSFGAELADTWGERHGMSTRYAEPLALAFVIVTITYFLGRVRRTGTKAAEAALPLSSNLEIHGRLSAAL